MGRIGFGSFWIVAVLGWTVSAQCEDSRRDVHSFSNPEEVRVRHLELGLRVDFETKTLTGSAIWTVERMPGSRPDAPLILDTRDLRIEKVEAGADIKSLKTEGIQWSLGKADPVLGQALTISLPPNANRLRITYKTSPSATRLTMGRSLRHGW